MECRLCRSRNNLEQINREIKKIIKTVLLIPINKDDGLSQAICNQCFVYLNSFMRFKENVLQVQETLKKHALNKSSSQSENEIHNQIIDIKPDIVTNQFTENVTDRIQSLPRAEPGIDLERVRRQPHLEWQPPGTSCKICHVTLNTETSFLKHFNSRKHLENSNLLNDLDIKQNTPVIVCKTCKKVFRFQETYNHHVSKYHPGILLCVKCEFESRSRKNYIVHLRKHETYTSEQQLCSICFKPCNGRKELLAHRRIIHFNVLNQCTIFENTCLGNADAELGKLSFVRGEQNENRIFPCSRCCLKFSTFLMRKKHLCKPKKFPKCPYCHKIFSDPASVRRHQLRSCKEYKISEYKSKNNNSDSLRRLENHALARLTTEGPNKEDDIEDFNSIEEHAPAEKMDDILKCKNCKTNYPSIFELEVHYKMCSEQRGKVKCYCGSVFVNGAALRLHKKVDHLLKSSTKVESKRPVLDDGCANAAKDQISQKKDRTNELILESANHHEIGYAVKSSKKKRDREVSSPFTLSKLETFACQRCGLVFNGEKFLQMHEYSCTMSLPRGTSNMSARDKGSSVVFDISKCNFEKSNASKFDSNKINCTSNMSARDESLSDVVDNSNSNFRKSNVSKFDSNKINYGNPNAPNFDSSKTARNEIRKAERARKIECKMKKAKVKYKEMNLASNEPLDVIKQNRNNDASKPRSNVFKQTPCSNTFNAQNRTAQTNQYTFHNHSFYDSINDSRECAPNFKNSSKGISPKKANLNVSANNSFKNFNEPELPGKTHYSKSNSTNANEFNENFDSNEYCYDKKKTHSCRRRPYEDKTGTYSVCKNWTKSSNYYSKYAKRSKFY